MRWDIATPHLSDRPPQCHQHKNRQQMDGAENANNLRFMNKKAADCDERHQSGPDLAKLPVPWRSLGHTQLEATEDKRKHSRNRMGWDRHRSRKQRRNIHLLFFIPDSPGPGTTFYGIKLIAGQGIR